MHFAADATLRHVTERKMGAGQCFLKMACLRQAHEISEKSQLGLQQRHLRRTLNGTAGAAFGLGKASLQKTCDSETHDQDTRALVQENNSMA